MTTEEGEEDPRNISIPESEGHHEVTRLKVEFPNISKPLKTKQVNIGLEVQPNFANKGEYWDEDTVDKVVELLREYRDLFPTKFSYLKGILGDISVMKITLKPNAKPMK